MKNIPNLLTTLRIVLAFILLVSFNEVSPAFISIFLFAMLTDLLDGMLARYLDVASPTGALLDTIADFLLDANLIKIVFTTKVMTKTFTVWMIAALSIGAISPIINYIKHKKLFFIHSIPCKICMWALLVIPFAIRFGFIYPYLIFTLSLISYAMIELVILSFILKEPDPNAKSIYYVIKQNKAIKI